jgi:PAS domain S-box-containing protein
MVLNARRVDHMQLILLAIEDQIAGRHIFLIDQEGQWGVQNPRLERLSAGLIPSRDPEQTVRWHPVDGIDPRNWPSERALRGDVVAPGIDFRAEVDGEDCWLRASAAPIDGDGAVEHAVVIVEDVTDARQVEEERELLLGELNHRVRNLFGIIRSLVSQEGGGPEVDAYKKTLGGRLEALARAHSLAIEGRWRSIDLTTLAHARWSPTPPRTSRRRRDRRRAAPARGAAGAVAQPLRVHPERHATVSGAAQSPRVRARGPALAGWRPWRRLPPAELPPPPRASRRPRDEPR